MMWTPRTLCAVALVIVGCSTDVIDGESERRLTGSDRYVDLSATDPEPDGTQARPFQTLAAALAAAQPGDTLHLRTNRVYPSTTIGKSDLTITAWSRSEDGDPPRVVFDPGLRDLTWTQLAPGDGREHAVWKSTQEFPASSQGVRGQMLDSKLRLVTYGALFDLAADNQSFARLRAGDSRAHKTTTAGEKVPYTYLGPGLRFEPNWAPGDDPAKGRIYLRLDATAYEAPGVDDFVAPTSPPDDVPMSITFGPTFAMQTGGSNLRFRNVVFQNGGEYTLRIVAGSNVSFESCEVWAGTHGVLVGPQSQDVSFEDCVFDGGVAPWTARVDLKGGYVYQEGGAPKENKLGVETSKVLVQHNQSERGRYTRCTFRRGHDGIEVTAGDIVVSQSLFENLNDEAIRFVGAPAASADTRIVGNVLRQVLIAFSYVGNVAGGPPVHIYRNVVDQRVPTLGYRVLKRDAAQPWLWRWGADFKPNGDNPVGEFRVYQNTFIESHLDDETQTQTMVFSGAESGPPRTFYDNLHVGLNLALPYSRVAAGRTSAGNQWFHYPETPHLFVSGEQRVPLETVQPGWELGSIVRPPALVRFSDEWLAYRDAYPVSDYRPTEEVLGVALPETYPVPLDGHPQQVGALFVDSAPLVVGAAPGVAFVADGAPVADAGADQLAVVDAQDDGFETVVVDGTDSSAPGGAIVRYQWLLDGREVASTAVASIYLPAGHHHLRLVVEDAAGQRASDAVDIAIGPVARPENRITCGGFDLDACGWVRTNTNFANNPAAIHTGSAALRIIESTAERRAVQRISVTVGARYTIGAWMKTSNVAGRAVLAVAFVDASGAVAAPIEIAALSGTQPYQHRAATVAAPAGAVAMDVIVKADASSVSGSAYFDDVRVRDGNPIVNGHFDAPSPSASLEGAPGWSGDVVLSATRRSGTASLALIGDPQKSREVESSRGLATGGNTRVSFWLWTDNVAYAVPDTSLRFQIFAYNAAGVRSTNVVTPAPSPDGFTLVETTLAVPLDTVAIQVRLAAPKMTGTAYIDDILVQAAP